MLNVVFYVVLVVHVVSSLLLILTVLLQRPKSEGLGASFGGAITDSVFGAQTSDILVKASVWLGTIVLTATLALATIYSHTSTRSGINQKVLDAPDSIDETAAPAPQTTAPAAEAKAEVQKAATPTAPAEAKK
jgi:preprotein translocase subunit SecG